MLYIFHILVSKTCSDKKGVVVLKISEINKQHIKAAIFNLFIFIKKVFDISLCWRWLSLVICFSQIKWKANKLVSRSVEIAEFYNSRNDLRWRLNGLKVKCQHETESPVFETWVDFGYARLINYILEGYSYPMFLVIQRLSD